MIKKNLTDQILFSLYLGSWWSDLQNSCLFPHSKGGIVGGRHQHFEDPITWTRDIRKTKFDPLGVFLSPFRMILFHLYQRNLFQVNNKTLAIKAKSYLIFWWYLPSRIKVYLTNGTNIILWFDNFVRLKYQMVWEIWEMKTQNIL